jgi:hypothetical protein
VNIKPALFYSISDLSYILDRGVYIEFKRLRFSAALLHLWPARLTRYLVSVNHKQDLEKENVYKPRPTSELEEQQICIIHELIHAALLEKSLVLRGTLEELEDLIEDHVYSFLGNDLFFEQLIREIDKRKNCGFFFRAEIFDRNEKTRCPFYHYYNKVLDQESQPMLPWGGEVYGY